MLRILSAALLLAASPALAQDAAPAESNAAEASADQPLAFKTKRVCRTVEVVGSAVPKTTCTTRKIPIRPPVEDAPAEESRPASESGSQP